MPPAMVKKHHAATPGKGSATVRVILSTARRSRHKKGIPSTWNDIYNRARGRARNLDNKVMKRS
ncbi:hypothetical protein FRACA_50048 [Frankia canadensis]|uniref:Uncharacterized protein n=1 Tax=Frankia canadensis TaxID=1836972 RepID=A0A2I2KYC7_9ACTN|nr:hypothetical protein FRACA_50048 [Frankia canadensis]SOU57950.1 hypothetical protein FRACA_50048 [Frankia canadensis]